MANIIMLTKSLPFLAIAGLMSSTALATEYPITIENCNQTLTFDAAPEKTVSIGQATTEALYSLGLAEKVIGTAVWHTDVLEQYAEANSKIERIADHGPSFEAVVNKRPELVTSQYEFYVGPSGTVGTREQFHDLGINTYNWPADCAEKDNSKGVDGTRQDLFSMDDVYQGITELAYIYDAEAAGEKLVADLKHREAEAIEQAKKVEIENASAVFWFSSAKMEADPYVAGAKGAPAYMMSTLGVKNVIESNEEWPTVGWETIAKANPTFIVLADMTRRKYPADDYEKKIEFLKNDPVTQNMDAVKHDRIIILNAHAMDPTIRVVTGIEALATAIKDFQ